MTPDEFRTEYVEPAVELWRTNNTVTHLAANAIAQLDALADVVWLAQGKPTSRPGEFRDQLGAKDNAIAVVRDACDSHKHGELHRSTATHISGERPEQVVRHGYFADVSFLDGPPLAFGVLVIRKKDGAEVDISNVVYEAMQAWRREFGRLGYGTDWLIFGKQTGPL